MPSIPSPTNVRARIDEAVLQQLYVEQRLTIDRLAARLGVAPTTVSRRMRELGIKARPRGPASQRRAEDIRWSAELAWVVGLITTDGNLSVNGRALAITSKDRVLLEIVQKCLGLRRGIRPALGGWGHDCFRLQWTDRALYLWLSRIGLMPAKSLRLGPLAVPDEYFRDFLRGCIDGDGSIVTYVDHHNTRKRSTYIYERLYVSIVSASPRFLEWLRATVLRLAGLAGHLTIRRERRRRDMWCLRYAKRESVRLLKWMYYSPDAPALPRKRQKAAEALSAVRWYRHDISGTI